MSGLTPRQKFNAQKAGAARRGIEFLFSFDEWWTWWSVDDRWAKRGRGKGKLTMARIGDSGPYHPSNVYCATHAENMADIAAEVKVEGAQRGHVNRKSRGVTIPLDMRGAGHPRSRPVQTPDGEFESGGLAADHYGVTKEAIYYRVAKNFPGYHWIDEGKR